MYGYNNNNPLKAPASNRGKSHYFRGQHSNSFRGEHSNNFRGQHSYDFRGQYSNNFRGQHSNNFHGQYSNSNDYLQDFSSEAHHKIYEQSGQMGAPQYQHNYYRQMNVPQSQNSRDQTSGYPQHPHPTLDRSTTQRNHNYNRSHQEKTVRHGDEYKNYTCPGCCQHFDFSGRSNRYFGRIPLILNCQHTVCQDCINKEVTENSIICPLCHVPSEIPDKEGTDGPGEAFIPNFYILGMIAWAKPPGTQLLLVSQPTTKTKKSIAAEQVEPPEPEGEKCGFLPCHKRAVLRCRDCNDVFCVDCCTMVHKNVKAMWSHVQVQITNGNFSAELEKCSEHNTDVEVYCNTCSTSVCCYCFIEKHESHEKEYLSKLSAEELNNFHVYKDKAEQVLRQLLVSKRKLKDLCEGGTTTIEKNIHGYFRDLFGRLHLFQKKLIKELSSFENINKPDNGLAQLMSNLDNSIRTWRNILVAAENMDGKKINLRGILQKLKDIDQTPCYLLFDSSNGANFTEFCPNPILENLDELFTVKQSSDYNLQLVSTNDLPPDYVKDPTDLQYELDIYGSNSSYGAQSKDESNSYNKKISSQTGPCQTKGKNFGQRKKIEKKAIREIGNFLQIPLDNELVEVTHIESLECFYVQLKKHQSLFTQMNKDIENYIKMGANPVTSPQINELYLAMYVTKTERIWCRGRLTAIKTERATPLYEVYFIDFGSTQMLDISKLREITPHLAQKKSFAIQCELYNPAYTNWNKNAHVYMGKVINGKEIYLVVKNVNNGIYVVDLMISSSDRGLTSIIDILIYACSNALSSSSDSLSSVRQKNSYVPELKIYNNSFKFHKKQIENVVIANVIDPHNIFVHISSFVNLLKSMTTELKRHYKNKMSGNCLPVEGTYVVVEHKDLVRGNWHRALIKKVDIINGKAHVLLVDWGNTVIVPWSSLRLLTDHFTRLESQAVLVKLAHLEPYQGAKAWSENATSFIQKNFRTQDTLKMIVHRVDPLEVALFEIEGCVNICVNAQLVQEKYADSTGKISQTLEWPDGDQEQPELAGEEEDFVAGLLKKFDESPHDDSEDEDESDASRQPINIVKAVSPDLIYIKFVCREKEEEDFYKELQMHYNKDRGTKETWSDNEFCVAQLSDCFTRGQVISRVGDKYMVNLYDRAEELVLPKEKLCVASSYFQKFHKFVYRSHLADIRPAGGDNWSLSSIEALENIFEKHKEIFATKLPIDTQKRSIPMLMWYTHTKTVDALEPTITKFVSINKLLVKLGFAYKETSTTAVSNNEQVDSENEKSHDEGSLDKTADKLDESLESGGSENEVLKEKSSTVGPDKANTIGSSTDWNQLVEEEQNSPDSKQDSPYHTRETEITDWKPAFSIKKHEFNAYVLCADTEGILYLREENLQPVYENMEQNLKQYFDSQPLRAESNNWQPSQICTISDNDYWYRGKILKVNSPTEIIAIMIDFGSDHKLSPKQLHREILYPEIPSFASRIQLNGIYSKTGNWLTSDYDTLLEIITKFAKVVIKSPLDDEIPLAEVYDDKGQNINDLLVKLCPNLSRHPIRVKEEKSDEELALIEEEDPESLESVVDNQIDTRSMQFNVEPLPEKGFEDKVPMYIVAVLSYNKVVLKKIEESYDELNSINSDIQASCSTQPNIEDVVVGMPCICPYVEDNLWYRATVHSIDGIDCGYVFVFFVDFGNVDSVPIGNIRMMKPKWFDLPVTCYIADVNAELKAENHLEHVLQHMKKLLSKKAFVHFISSDPLVVDLFEKNGVLCYQSLISNGLLKLK
ncbi:RING finger protein 17 isoform X2 [Anoplophora glabripennis]|uniref:RING finger protein 17 isoform X2 n=1 Tax=Anoplophora glabripennis TaxID=217634 RepID=UPI0008747864|nr:RING finger protein 17 isoform X2 [Anoplophora glabripennis]